MDLDRKVRLALTAVQAIVVVGIALVVEVLDLSLSNLAFGGVVAVVITVLAFLSFIFTGNHPHPPPPEAASGVSWTGNFNDDITLHIDSNWPS